MYSANFEHSIFQKYHFFNFILLLKNHQQMPLPLSSFCPCSKICPSAACLGHIANKYKSDPGFLVPKDILFLFPSLYFCQDFGNFLKMEKRGPYPEDVHSSKFGKCQEKPNESFHHRTLKTILCYCTLQISKKGSQFPSYLTLDHSFLYMTTTQT
jgi:hypothetical protein